MITLIIGLLAGGFIGYAYKDEISKAIESIKAILKKYPNATEQVWAQEEPQNQGAWMYIRDAFDEVTGKAGSIKYIGRKKSASPAAGHLKVHAKEQEELVKLALT